MNHQSAHLSLPLLSDSRSFTVANLTIDSKALRENPLGDLSKRHNLVLVPAKKMEVPVVFHLSGYYGNGYNDFNYKTLEENLPQRIIRLTESKKIPLALHVFVDAMTSVGGSQFINSDGCGKYSDYIQKELTLAVRKNYLVKESVKYWALMGSSSGGYGALHHISQKKSPFGIAVAIAPDSHFESSLLPEMYKMSPYLQEYETIARIQKGIGSGAIKKQKSSFHIMNALAMSLCYGNIEKGKIQFPLDLKTGEIKKSIWTHWKKKDPIVFLQKNIPNLKNKRIFLDVGIYDEFCLYYGARKVKSILDKNKIKCVYSEFEGGHFGSSKRKELALMGLKRLW